MMQKSVKCIILAVISTAFVVCVLFALYDYNNRDTAPQQQEENVITKHTPVRTTISHKQADKPYYPQLKLAISLLDILQKDAPKENIFYSPHSLYSTLLMAYFSATGETEERLKQILGLDWAENKADVQSAYKSKKFLFFKEQFYPLKNRFDESIVEFISANRLFVSKTLRIRDSVKELLNDSIEELNFADDPHECVNHINHFIEEATKNHTQNALHPSQITSETQLVMVNAAYFKGYWGVWREHETGRCWDRNKVERKIFYKPNGEEIYVDMLKRTQIFMKGYEKNLDADILKMPFYINYVYRSPVSMLIFLPLSRAPTAIDDMLNKTTAKILDDVFNDVNMYAHVTFHLPRLSFGKLSKLAPALDRIGIKHLFNNVSFSDNIESAEINLMHMAKIEMDENDPVDSSFSKFINFPGLNDLDKFDFNCNHPFMFMIHDQKFNEILFAGIYRG